MQKEKILIITPDASRSGAPTLLLTYLTWLVNNSNLKFVILFNTGGPLLEEFKKIADIFVFENILNSRNRSLIARAWYKLLNIATQNAFQPANIIASKINSKYKINLIICNSATNAYLLNSIKKHIFAKVLTYVHEGERFLKNFKNVEYSLSNSDKIISVSFFVKQYLITKLQLKQANEVIPGVITENITVSNNSMLIKSNYHIPSNKFIVMCCGGLSWHKGTDTFIHIAREINSYNKNIHFVWVGGSKDDIAFKQIQFDIELLFLENITIIPSVNNPIDLINLCDIFLVLSREESFSLVTIEAGSLKKPVLCFNKSGGPCEIVDYDERFIIPYLDIRSLSERILKLYESPKTCEEMGNYLFKRVMENYTVRKNGKALLTIIEKTMKG